MTDNKIPSPLIGITANIVGEDYTHSEITNGFLLCDYPDVSIGNKIDRVQRWFIRINKESDNPLKTYGTFISSFLDYEYTEGTHPYKEQIKLGNALNKYGFTYERGKIYREESVVSTPELKELTILSHEFISEQLEKAKDKISKGDFDGAITNARSLMESTQELIIEKSGETIIEYNGDLQKLYKQTKKILNLNVDSNMDEPFKQVLSGLNSIVSGISGISNNMGDRHSRKYKPEKHHALLIVNSAFSFCNFLVGSHEYQKSKLSKNTRTQ